ncbi:MAG: DUF4382 domain-containing protein [Fervidobacterium sp.]
MKKVLLVTSVVFVLLTVFSCTQISDLLSPNPKVSVVITSGSEGSGDVVKPQEYSGNNLLGLPQVVEAPWVKEIQRLVVKVSKFSYKYSTGPGESKWATPTSVDQVVDLVTLDSTEVGWLTFDAPKGAVILAIGFEITQATVTINNTEYPARLPNPAGTKIVLKNLNWSISEDGQIALSIDWTRSIIKILPSEYMLVPRIAYRWRGTLKDLWAIEGTVKVNGAAPTEPLLIGLFNGTDTTATPVVLKMIPVARKGEFYLGKHKPGTYTVVLWDSLSFTYEGTSITLTAHKAIDETFEHGKTNATTKLELSYTK